MARKIKDGARIHVDAVESASAKHGLAIFAAVVEGREVEIAMTWATLIRALGVATGLLRNGMNGPRRAPCQMPM